MADFLTTPDHQMVCKLDILFIGIKYACKLDALTRVRIQETLHAVNPIGGLKELGVKRLVLQPTSGWPSLRRTLILQGWTITDEVIHSAEGWLYITHVAQLLGGPPPQADDEVLHQTLLGPGALMADAQGSRPEAALLRFWVHRQLDHYRTRRQGILQGLASRRGAACMPETPVGPDVVEPGGGRAEEARTSRRQGSGGGGGAAAMHGNPGNLGPQKLTEVDSRIAILSQALCELEKM
jgi:hypothetical protein